ncbi:MAG: hypothetical protein IT160_07040 [Bryobacterales bacterium]|nr:hypothetical protein [Bryobacterales bacterium]
MTGVCKLCGALLMSEPVFDLGLSPEARADEEYSNLTDAAKRHMHTYHRDAIQVFNGLVGLLVGYLASLMVTCETESFLDAMERRRETVARQVRDSRLVIDSVPADETAGVL